MNADLVGQLLNLGSTVVGALLLLVFATAVDRTFWRHWVTKNAYAFLWLRWLSYFVAYLVLLKGWHGAELLPILDIGSISTLLFAVIFISGDDDQSDFWKRSKKWLIAASGLLAAAAVSFMARDNIPVEYRLLYMLVTVAPSEITANIGTVLMGWAFLVRYRSLTAYALLALCLLYAFAQMPAYADVFAFRDLAVAFNQPLLRSPAWIFFFLAPMKILIAAMTLCLLYTPFVRPSQKTQPRAQTQKPRSQAKTNDARGLPDDEMSDASWPSRAEPLPSAPKWPTEAPVPLHKNAKRILLGLCGTIPAIIAIAAAIKSLLK